MDPLAALNEYRRRPKSSDFNLAEFMQNMPALSPEQEAEQERRRNMSYVVLKIDGRMQYFTVENTEVAEKINTGRLIYQSVLK
jgi:hypothetical protein